MLTANHEMLDECGQERILLLGDPGLRKVCEPVADLASQAFQRNGRRLLRALEQFRSEHGFGRGIAAPQIGILERMIALNLGEGPFLVVNPVLTLKSDRRFTLWDDCMSFPWLMVRLERYSEIEMDFFSQTGEAQRWERIDTAVSELLQHETDHLDGVLAVDRALNRNSIIAREVYQERRPFFDAQVDYAIVPTIRVPGTQR